MKKLIFLITILLLMTLCTKLYSQEVEKIDTLIDLDSVNTIYYTPEDSHHLRFNTFPEYNNNRITPIGSRLIKSDSLGNSVTINIYSDTKDLVIETQNSIMLYGSFEYESGEKYLKVFMPKRLSAYDEFVSYVFETAEVIGFVDKVDQNDMFNTYQIHCSYMTLTEFLYYYLFTE